MSVPASAHVVPSFPGDAGAIGDVDQLHAAVVVFVGRWLHPLRQVAQHEANLFKNAVRVANAVYQHGFTTAHRALVPRLKQPGMQVGAAVQPGQSSVSRFLNQAVLFCAPAKLASNANIRPAWGRGLRAEPKGYGVGRMSRPSPLPTEQGRRWPPL